MGYDANIAIGVEKADFAQLKTGGILELKARVRAGIASAKYRNSLVSDPWAAVPDWQASTTYICSTVVKSGGFMYLLFGNATATGQGSTPSTGISGASSPFNANPYSSGQNVGLITDNTCRWIFYGVAPTPITTRPQLSTVTPAAASDVMDGFVAFVANTALTTLGLTKQVSLTNVAQDQNVFFTGGVYDAANNAIYGPNTGTLGTPVQAVSSQRPVLVLETDARWIAFQPAGPLYNSHNLAIEVNGRLLSPGPVIASTTNSNFSYLLDLTSFGKGPKVIRVFGYQDYYNCVARYIYVGPTDTVISPKNPNRFSIAYEGDSITQGGNSSPIFPGLDVAAQTARFVGCDHWYNNAVGGTGFLSDNSGTKTTYINRLAGLTAFAPNILIIGGNHNDTPTWNSAQRQAAILAYLQAVRAALPRTMIFAQGGQLLQGDSATGTTQLQLETDMQAAVAAFNDANCIFVPFLTDTSGAWITGTGTGTSPQGNGNKDRYYWVTASSPYNDGHPYPPYYEYKARRDAEMLMAWANT